MKYLPFVYSEHGAIQAANVLHSTRAAQMSVHVILAFVRLRQVFTEHKILSAKLDELEGRVGEHDAQTRLRPFAFAQGFGEASCRRNRGYSPTDGSAGPRA